MANATEASAISIPAPPPLHQSAIAARAHHVQSVEVDPITDMLGQDDLELEVFMNEMVTIRIHDTNEDGALRVAEPQVNSVMHPILRGVPTKVRRKYVEVLANARTIRYVQVQGTAGPDDTTQVGHPALSYPFEVLEDTPRGKTWLRRMLARPA